MTYVPSKMGTLLVPSGPKVDGLHLFVIMTNPCADNQHLLLSITSIRDGKRYDPTCVFNGGEHPFITHPCYVWYRRPEQRTVSNIQKCVAGWLFHVKEDLALNHFQRICEGIEVSDDSAPWMIEYFRANQ